MLDCSLIDALECVHLAYGWRNARKLWIETRGFTTSLKTAMADYPNSGIVPDKELMRAVGLLRDFPDPCDEIERAMDAAIYDYDDDTDSYGETMGVLFDEHGEEAVKALLKKHADEQLWEDYRNKQEYERIEAAVAGSNSQADVS